MAKGKAPHKYCKEYLGKKQRIKNKTIKLEKKINHLQKEREIEKINPNTKLPVLRKLIENIKTSCRIGRKKEGFNKEEFKNKPPKVKKPIQKSTK